MMFELPISNDEMLVIFTRNIYNEVEINKFKELLKSRDWSRKWLILPSEYVDRVEIKKRIVNND